MEHEMTLFEKVKILYDSKVSKEGIFEVIDISKRNLERIISILDKGFNSSGEYRDYIVRQKINPETDKPFASTSEYHDYLVRQKINPETGEHFTSISEYNDYLARQKGSKNFQRRRMKLHRFKRPIDLLNFDARKRGYQGFHRYNAVRKLVNQDEGRLKVDEVIDPFELEKLGDEGALRRPRYGENHGGKKAYEIYSIIGKMFEEGSLSEREVLVVRGRAEGKTLMALKEEYGLSKSTIRDTVSRALRKIKEYSLQEK